jgi:hypothetical protein
MLERSKNQKKLTALRQKGSVGSLMRITALFVMVPLITLGEASFLISPVRILGTAGRLVTSWMSDVFGRRPSNYVAPRVTLDGIFPALLLCAGSARLPVPAVESRTPVPGLLR